VNVIRCPHCDRKLKLPSELAGKNLRCPHCKTMFTVPVSAVETLPAVPPPPGRQVEPSAPSRHVEPPLPRRPVEPPISSREADEPVPSRLAQPPLPSQQVQPLVPRRHTRSPVPRRHKPAPDASHSAPLSRSGLHIDHEELIDMTAMVDIVFFLLIFFLVTSMAGIMSSAKLPKPESQDDENGAKTQQVEDQQSDANAVIVKINKDDLIEIEGVPYHDINDLIVRLRQLRNSGGAETALMVVGHGDATHGTAVSILDAGYEVGIDRLRLAVTGGEAE